MMSILALFPQTYSLLSTRSRPPSSVLALLPAYIRALHPFPSLVLHRQDKAVPYNPEHDMLKPY